MYEHFWDTLVADDNKDKQVIKYDSLIITENVSAYFGFLKKSKSIASQYCYQTHD